MARKAKTDTTSDNLKKEPSKIVAYWLNEIAAAKKREKDYREDGERIIKIYDGQKADTTPFNILFSNTETLLPALYSAVPRPVVQRRFKDDDPIGKAAALAGQRVLEFLLDTNIEGYETFDEGVKSATLDALLPGRGITCVKYDAEIGEMLNEAEPTPYKKSELVCLDTKSWNRVYFGYAKKWSNVPWVAYEEHIDREEAVRLFGEEMAKNLVFTKEEDEKDEKNDDEKDKGERKTACIYQIWDKEGDKNGPRRIRYVSPQYNDGYLMDSEDPLGLTGFFNCPKPIQFIEKSNDRTPTALYIIYENQAKELNEITRRIHRVVKAIKAKALYDGELGEDIQRLIEADDNMMIPADKTSSLAAEKGLGNAIWFMPIEQLIATLVQLYTAREQCKQVIYEITGISDIVRGSSKASETLGAQEIKTQWGTLRLKRLQKEVQRYARDLLRMMLEIAASKFSEDTWAKMTGLPFVTTEQRTKLEQIGQAMMAEAQRMQAAGQQPNQQQLMNAQKVKDDLGKPVWGQVLATLRDDTQRAYKIDIETNSTVEPEAVEDQKNISDLMTALGQFLNGIGPMVAKGVMPFEAAQTMLLAITRRFRFGSEIEDQIKAMKAPPPEDDGKAQAEKDKQAAETQREGMKIDADKLTNAAKLLAEQESAKAKAQVEKETAIETARIQAEAQVKIARMNAIVQQRIALQDHKLRLREMRMAEQAA